MKPSVTIVCISYNQEKYIRQAIESFLMQKVNFAYEIIIHDDASTDGTQEIIKEFIQKYPKIFRPLLEVENQFSKTGTQFLKNMYQMAKGKYIAICEGDDFWTDPLKLQKQFDFMEKNKDYTLCFHPVKVFFESGEQPDSIFPDTKTGFTVENLLRGNFIQTNSVFYRKQDYTPLATNLMPMDWYVSLYHAQFGKIGFINKVMSSYRRHEGGAWWGTEKKDAFFSKALTPELNLLNELSKMYKDTPYGTSSIEYHATRLLSEAVTQTDKSRQLFTQVAKGYPGYIAASYQKSAKEIQENAVLINELNAKLEALNYHYEHTKKELDEIKQSKAYKLGLATAAPVRRLKGVFKR
ncbi:MAG: glycosyltransferase [Candidatus Saccharimonadaceae bacterium]